MKENDTQQIVIKIPPEEINFVDMVFKSYEGLAMLTINHEEMGVVYLDVTEGTREEVLEILADLSNKFQVDILKK